MTTQAVKKFIADSITNSLTVAPGSFTPTYQACYGILNAKGFTVANTFIRKTRPSKEMGLGVNNFAVLINNVSWQGTHPSEGDDYRRLHTIRIDVIWIAEFKNVTNIATAPTYTSEDAATANFTKFLDALEKTLVLANADLVAADDYYHKSVTITDPFTSETSCIEKNRYPITVQIYDPDPREGSLNLMYGASINCQYLEDVDL